MKIGLSARLQFKSKATLRGVAFAYLSFFACTWIAHDKVNADWLVPPNLSEVTRFLLFTFMELHGHLVSGNHAIVGITIRTLSSQGKHHYIKNIIDLCHSNSRGHFVFLDGRVLVPKCVRNSSLISIEDL
jgi:hypothetical protein